MARSYKLGILLVPFRLGTSVTAGSETVVTNDDRVKEFEAVVVSNLPHDLVDCILVNEVQFLNVSHSFCSKRK